MFEIDSTGYTINVTRFGLGCECPREHFCGHCLTGYPEGGAYHSRKTPIAEEYPFCGRHGWLSAKDVITVYPEGHTKCDHA
jgi:hypothetical protein